MRLKGEIVSGTSQETYAVSEEDTRRYVRRVSGPGLAFIPYGLIPAIGLALLTLFALVPFASHWIEDNAEQAALSALRSEGEGWASVSASGQWVTLNGQAPSAERAAKAVELVRSSRASTFFGHARPVTRVIDRTTLGAANGGSTTLSPEPNTDADALQAAPDDDTESSAPLVRAEAPSEERIAACDRSLRTLLDTSKIKFATGSARIAAESSDLLDQLAEAVTGCDLAIVIEGHTDSTGSATVNERLSLSRAQAVREALVIRGVARRLLEAEGFGAANPVASNETPEGREQNRRIEFNVRSGTEAEDE